MSGGKGGGRQTPARRLRPVRGTMSISTRACARLQRRSKTHKGVDPPLEVVEVASVTELLLHPPVRLALPLVPASVCSLCSHFPSERVSVRVSVWTWSELRLHQFRGRCNLHHLALARTRSQATWEYADSLEWQTTTSQTTQSSKRRVPPRPRFPHSDASSHSPALHTGHRQGDLQARQRAKHSRYAHWTSPHRRIDADLVLSHSQSAPPPSTSAQSISACLRQKPYTARPRSQRRSARRAGRRTRGCRLGCSRCVRLSCILAGLS